MINMKENKNVLHYSVCGVENSAYSNFQKDF